uniref:Uncharacterized protein n=1 Tax=Anguilla anguilla TaxID=7936 RepID=A0A0E9QI48_ANGAN
MEHGKGLYCSKSGSNVSQSNDQ